MKIIGPLDSAGRYGITPYNKLTAAVSHKIPGMAWNANHNAYVGYPDAAALVAGILQKNGHEVEGDIPDPGQWDRAALVAPKLRDYQHLAVSFLQYRQRAILADDMGLGKSATALHGLACVGASARRVVIVCPSYVRPVWVSEIAKWQILQAPVFLPRGRVPRAQDLPAYGIVVIHYDILPGWADILAQWGPGVVIFDEGHLLSNEKSQRSKAARLVSAGAQYVWALTGTPLTNRASDLWNLVDTICPGRFGGFFGYGLRYCAGHQEQITNRQGLPQDIWVFRGSSHEEELAYRLKYFMLRRTKSQVSLELPSLTRRVVPIEIRRAPRMPSDPFASPTQARAALDAAANAKVQPALEYIRGELDGSAPERKAVIFTWRRAIAEEISNALGGLLIHGRAKGMTDAIRDKRLHEFRTDPNARILVATIDSTGTGIDLTCASDAYFVELTWEPHELLQAESRLHRFGAQMPVMITYLIAAGTVDEIISNTVIDKLVVGDKIIGRNDAGLSEAFGSSEVDPLVALQRAWLAK